METWLEKNLHRLLPWLYIDTPQTLAEFSAHLGWSLAVPAVAFVVAGRVGLLATAGVWLVYSVLKEVVEDGHGGRIILGTESPDERRDFATDLLARVLPALLLAGAVGLFRP